MRLTADSGLWTTGPLVAPAPLVAVLEVSGAVLSWTVDDSTDAQIAFTDPARADWLWRVVGETGHHAVVCALGDRVAVDSVEVAGVTLLPDALAPLRRLALGHWLRRWWPASQRDAIATLDGALLDAEVALLTAAAQDYFGDETFDSEITHLLAPHSAALDAAVHEGDPRVTALVELCRNVADDVGVALDAGPVSGRRADYALAAGADTHVRSSAVIGDGTASLNWAAVPPGVFDAAEDTVTWSIEATGDGVSAVVDVELAGQGTPHGITVRLESGTVGGTGVLGADGRASFPVVDTDSTPISETFAWNHDWRGARVVVGADVDESAQTRERVRAFARSRMDQPGPDAFLAEILAAESDY
ncbi:hypothetical protein AU184_06425 [Mycolicibacterium novocastrense]|uniref:hypothetical protein n=1 Tax=Mycolicibacterium novocastrense TaxID=59813 RepID=UPI0007466619|nr:hypothetical protein [Mycolicibacterium novocastrense]KUH67179.1 hypothetical protein AU184_06425 [Mycolicibacterium novocastrense]KUH68181.1 hypothetical protein AU183_04815 [Mycolicibacterium novocastrense]KUH68647.1 hypothetical protein AU072_00585 [Mycolicibacterium novocastrense]